MQTITTKLSTGTVLVQAKQSEPTLESLFSFAERQNPKRAFLFVSKILGKHIPVSPAIMRQSYQSLAGKIPLNLPEPIVFFGMAETAIGLGSGIFEEVLAIYPDALFMISTRHEVPNADKLCEFKEEHSHATDHIIYQPDTQSKREHLLSAKTLVLVDDEATTGKTFLNLYHGLAKAGLNQVERLITVTLTNWSNRALSQSLDIPVDELSLIEGQWEWHPDPLAPAVAMPTHTAQSKAGAKISRRFNFGREGILARPAIEALFDSFLKKNDFLSQLPQGNNRQSVLVLGSSEFAYIPFLLAEKIEQLGFNVKFSATTRSPIAEGLAIESILKFDDNYGEGVTHYCYNVAHQHFDRIIVCVETQSSSIDEAFLGALRHSTQHISLFSLLDD